MHQLNIEFISRPSGELDQVIAIARRPGESITKAGLGQGGHQKAAIDAVNAYFANERDRDVAKKAAEESMAARPADMGPDIESVHRVANALEFGDPDRRVPLHPLQKRVAVSPDKIKELLTKASELRTLVRIVTDGPPMLVEPLAVTRHYLELSNDRAIALQRITRAEDV